MEKLKSSELITVSRSQLQEIADRLGLRLFLKDKKSKYIGCNKQFALDAGYLSPDDVIGKTDSSLSWRSNARLCVDNDQHVMSDGMSNYEKHECPDYELESSAAFLTTKIPLRNEKGEISGVFGVYRDQSVPSNTESARARLRRAYQLLIASNHCIIAGKDELGIFSGICDLVIKNGYKMSWVGVPEHDEGKTVRAIAISGSIKGYLDDIKISWGHNEYGNGPTGRALREAKTIVHQDVLNDPALVPWKEVAVDNGFESTISLPLIGQDGVVFAALTIYAVEPFAFDIDEVTLLEELSKTLSFGISAIQERNRRIETLECTVSAIVATLESRDPYTAGHQERVAHLASQIALEMHIQDDIVMGINVAAMLHDVGKIHIPIEFLTSPCKLSKAEMDVVRSHPEVGYNILKNVPFPWPVAELVRQHHEFIDGSGYPRGLKADEILLGAKVIAVADTVEAMSTRRPYRSPLGQGPALSEIKQQRGKHYDAEVVDACLKVFENGYKFVERNIT